MAKRNKPMVRVFIVSWFPIGAKSAATMMCISRESANARVAELKASFEPYPNHDPVISIDRTEVRES